MSGLFTYNVFFPNVEVGDAFGYWGTNAVRKRNASGGVGTAFRFTGNHASGTGTYSTNSAPISMTASIVISGPAASSYSATASTYTTLADPLVSSFALSSPSASQVTVNIVAPANSTAGLTGVEIERSLDDSNWSVV